MTLILPFNDKTPAIHPTAFVAPNAVIIGDVTVGPRASVWFGAVLRGDDPDHGIVVGAGSSVQDNCVVHVGVWGSTTIGAEVTVGHGAKLECCTIGDRTVVGMNAVILQSAVVGAECVLAANTVVLEGAEIPPRSVVAGVPGVVKKTLEGSAAEWISRGGRHYVELGRAYLDQGLGAATRLCDLCGAPMLDRHCKLVCTRCGYQRDCSDP
ncbi:MAG: gamma carbonic anhydrase family protein [Gemmatimonadota bacterium]|jgi:carbonic anhydrase/acetyltransferase-like protein (isoleucine patch superfamily)